MIMRKDLEKSTCGLFESALVVRFQVLKAASMNVTCLARMFRRVFSYRLTDVSEVLTASIIRMNYATSQQTVIFILNMHSPERTRNNSGNSNRLSQEGRLG
jgi:hypothetical protein